MFGNINNLETVRSFNAQSFPQPSFMLPGQSVMPNAPTSSGFNMSSLLDPSFIQSIGGISSGIFSFLGQLGAYSAEQSFGRFQQQQYGLQAKFDQLAIKAQELETRQKALNIRKRAAESAAKAQALFASKGVARSDTASLAMIKSLEQGEQDVEQAFLNQPGFGSLESQFKGVSSGIKTRLSGINRLINMTSNVQTSLLSNLTPKMFGL